MTSRERVYKALRFEKPDRAPRDLWMLPGIRMFRASELRLVHERYPVDIVLPVDTNGDAPSALRAWGGDIDDLPIYYPACAHTRGDPCFDTAVHVIRRATRTGMR